jgi:hypothetical protein
MISEVERIWKVPVMAQFEVISWHLLGRTEETHEKHQASWSQSEYVKSGPPKYEAGVLPTQP